MQSSLKLKSKGVMPNGLLHPYDIGRPGMGPLFNSDGEANVGSKKELLSLHVALANMAQQSGAGLAPWESREDAINRNEVHKQMLYAALEDPHEFADLGDQISEVIEQTVDRQAFMRVFLLRQEVEQGNTVRVRLNQKDTVANVAVGPSLMQRQIIRPRVDFIQEFYIRSRPYIEQLDIDQSPGGDLVQETLTNATTAFLVQEDLTWKRLVDGFTGEPNPLTNASGRLSPETFAEVVSLVTRWGIGASFALFASNIWQDLVSQEAWANIFDPVSQYDLIQTGRLGTLHGMQVLSDHYRHPEHKVLDAGEFYVVGPPGQHGIYTDRDGIRSRPLTDADERIPGQGWSMYERLSAAVVNARSVAKGKRVSV